MHLLAALLFAEAVVREMVYPGATILGGQAVPRYDKGYLIYLERDRWLEVHAPDGQLAFRVQVLCPGTGTCSSLAGAANSRGEVAVTLAWRKPEGWAAGIQIFSADGKPRRLIDTGRLVPQMLCFDRSDSLWVLGWQRDAILNDREDTSDYPLLRKFDPTGMELGRFLPRSLWPEKKSAPGSGSGGYWRMAAASDRVGAVIHENYADIPAEWVEWDLNGKLLTRNIIPSYSDMGRAYTSDGALYRVDSGRLSRLDSATGKWIPAAAKPPDRALLFGADGDDLVFRMGPGNVRLLYVRPDK